MAVMSSPPLPPSNSLSGDCFGVSRSSVEHSGEPSFTCGRLEMPSSDLIGRRSGDLKESNLRMTSGDLMYLCMVMGDISGDTILMS